MPLLFDIKRYALNDGPGIRITVFFKGCPLSCIWCHNPEGIAPHPQKLYTAKRCIGCRSCIDACPAYALTVATAGIVTNPMLCTVCGQCVEACPTKAMEISGRKYKAEKIMKEIEKEIPFMDQSGGGVTFCGGEPLMQPTALADLLVRCGRLDLHRTVDTSLYASPATLSTIIPETDLFLVDLKLIDSAKHRYYCGAPNEGILANIRTVSEARKPFTIRIPLIEGINADDENLQASARFLAELPTRPHSLQFLPYHDLGHSKHAKLGTLYNPDRHPMSVPSSDHLAHARSIFALYGIEASVG
ncbi:MAG: glycyl-radical enzyme activating protein [Tannerellaceae bacterium]|jgi:pyruvate formate lyase activating enzyme|nr:glycyl-radical enzyme activating protein [Tannerellaceae bacterium]